MPGLMSTRRGVRRRPAAQGRPDHRLAAHDDPDGRADRDADRARSRGPLVQLQHLLDPGSRGRGRRRRPRRHARGSAGRARLRLEGRDARGVLVVQRAGRALARRRRPEHDPRRRRRRDACSSTRASSTRRPARCPTRPRPSPRSSASSSRLLERSLAEDSAALDEDRRRDQGRDRGDDDRRPPPLPDAGGRDAPVPGDQRQRLGDEVEVRQPLRLPALADRRPQPGDRRDDRRQGRRRLRLRRRRQGLRRVAARPGRPRDRHRDRPDLRPAGGDAGLPGHDARGRRRDAPTSSSPRPAT